MAEKLGKEVNTMKKKTDINTETSIHTYIALRLLPLKIESASRVQFLYEAVWASFHKHFMKGINQYVFPLR